MKAEYEVSVRIRFWGGLLDTAGLINSLDLNESICRVRVKGEEILRSNGERTGSIAKTSFVSYTCNSEFPELIRSPHEQLSYVLQKLKCIDGEFPEALKIDSSELQLSIYYGNQIDGDVDFVVPSELQAELVTKSIGVRITALP